MKVAFVIPAFVPNYGGPYHKVTGLATALVQRGIDVKVLTSTMASITGGIIEQVRAERTLDVEYCSYSWHYKWASIPSLAGYRRLTNILDGFQPDIVHIVGYRDAWTAIVAHWCYAKKIPYVWETVGMVKPVGVSLGKKAWYDKLIGHKQLRQAASIIATSDIEVDDNRSAGIETSHIRPNGLTEFPQSYRTGTVAEWQAQGIRFLAEKGHSIVDRDVLYLGRIATRKGLQLVVEKFPSNARLFLVGPDEDDGTREYIDRKIGARAIWVGRVSAQERWHYYAAASRCVLAAPYGENFGATVVESAAVGTRTFITPTVGAGQFLAPQNATVIEPKTDDWYAMLAQPTIKLKDQAVTKLRQQFSWNKLAGDQLQIYQDVCN